MKKESRVLVRLIALWIIFMASLGLFIWSAGNLTFSAIKTKLKGYENYSAAYNNYCLQYPQAPNNYSISGDQAENDQFKKEMDQYNKEYQNACKLDVAKLQIAQKNQEKSASAGDMSMYLVWSFLSLFFALISMVGIKTSEEVI